MPLSGKLKVSCLIFCIMVLYVKTLPAQDQHTKATRQSSLEAFTKGDYQLAYQRYTELLEIYPKDPLYKYYSGVCLVNLGVNPERAVTLLSQAQKDAAVVRTIPPDAMFWLGRAQQMAGMFPDAIESYRTFAERAGKKTAREFGTQEYIKQCEEGKGLVAKTEIKTGVPPGNETNSSRESVGSQIRPAGDQGKRPVVRETLPAGYERLLSEALIYQHKADSVLMIIEKQKMNLINSGTRERSELKAVITRNENVSASYQKLADQKYSEAQNEMNNTMFSDVKSVREDNPVKSPTLSTPVENRKIIQVTDSKTGSIRDTIVPEKTGTLTMQVKEESVKTEMESKSGKSEAVQEAVQEIKESAGICSVFEVGSASSVNKEEKIPVDVVLPPGLIYRIQVAVFRNPVTASFFKGITPVYAFSVPGSNLKTYYIGMFRKNSDALKALAAVKQKGFKDAFIVSLMEGKAVSAERAALLEKEWGTKPFVAALQKAPEISADTVPPVLSFRIEVLRSDKTVKDEVTDALKKLAGSKGLELVTLEDGNVVYLIGKFITFESAGEYADLLVRNGSRDAKVTAWLGKKEIPVETARQLFELK